MTKNLTFTLIVFVSTSIQTLMQAQHEDDVLDRSPFEVQQTDSHGYPRSLEYYAEIYGLNRAPEKDSIRFLWVRSFHPTILFTVACESDTSARFTASIWEKKNGWTTFSEAHMSREHHLEQLKRISDELGFFDLPRRIDRLGLDGSTWIIQVEYGDKNHWIDRWSPTRDSVAWLIGTELIGLSIDSPATPIY